jgi:hypothetical protein
MPVRCRSSRSGLKLDDLTRRAREGKLTGADVSGGSFTISNHGVSGSLLAAPIILHQGQAAILGIGKLEKRVVVREIDGQDAILVRPMAYVTLTIDHRGRRSPDQRLADPLRRKTGYLALRLILPAPEQFGGPARFLSGDSGWSVAWLGKQ